MPGGIVIPEVPILVPIGSVAAWLKTYTNTPALPSQWVECNGQTLSDPESVYNGQAIPNLNGDNRFLRGNAASGETGGEESHVLIIDEVPSHSHYTSLVRNEGDMNERVAITNDGGGSDIVTSEEGGNQPHNNLPPYCNVVWIMRVK